MRESDYVDAYFRAAAYERSYKNARTIVFKIHDDKLREEMWDDMKVLLGYGLPAMRFYLDNENGMRAIFLN